MVRTQIQLTEEQARSLKKLARKRRVSMAALIRMGVDEVLQSSAEISDEERRQRALDAAGKFRSGKRHVARRHDKYLAEAFKS